MTAYIPYADGFSVGDTLDWTKENLGQRNAKSTSLDKPITFINEPKVETRGCIVKTIKDAVQLLEIPPELALKVKIGQVKNLPIADIVKDLYDENVLTVVFQVRLCLFTTPKPIPDTPDSNSSNRQDAVPSHLSNVTAKVWGDELIMVMKLTSGDTRQSIDLASYEYALSAFLDYDDMMIDDRDLKRLTTNWAKQLDIKLSKPKDGSVPKMVVTCYSFTQFSQNPSTAFGCMSIINSFRTQCQQMASSLLPPAEAQFDNRPIFKFCDEESRSITGNPVLSPQSTDFIYQLRLCIQDNSGDVSIAARCEFTDRVFEAMRAIENMRTKVVKLNDPNVAVIRENTDDYKIGKRLENLKKDEKGIKLHVKQMGQGVASHTSLDILCQNALKLDLQIPGGSPLIMSIFGKTGHGKSSVGNSVLQKSIFTTSSDPASETNKEEKGETTIDGRELCIVDTPGLYDTHISNLSAMKTEAIDFIKKVITLSPQGYNAFLLAIKYGSRITNEEMEAITLFQRAFGKDVIKAHTVFVITAGDTFLSSSKNCFDRWCRNTTSPYLDKLFKECKYRCVLFDNITKKKDVIQNQLIRLISLVDTIGSRYNDGVFQLAEASRDQIRQEILSPERREKLLIFLNYVLRCCKEGEELDPETLKQFSKIQKEAEKLSNDDKSVIFPLVENINILLERQNEMQQKERERKAREQEERIQQEQMEKVLRALHQTGELIETGTIMFQESLKMLEINKTQAKQLPQNLQYIVEKEIRLIEDTCNKNEKTRLEEEKQREKAEKYQTKVLTLNAQLRSISLFVIDNDELDHSKLDILNKTKTEAEDLMEHDCNNILGQIEAIKRNNEKNKQNIKKEKEFEEAYDYQEKIKNMMTRLEYVSSSVVMGTEINAVDLKFLNETETEVRCLKKNDQTSIQRQIETIKNVSEKNKHNREQAEKQRREAENYQQKVKNLQNYLTDVSRSVNKGEEIDPEERNRLNELLTEAKVLKQDDQLHIHEQITIIIKIIEKNTNEKAEKIRRETILNTILVQLRDMESKIEKKEKVYQESLDNLKKEEDKICHFPEEEKVAIFAIKRNILKQMGKEAAEAINDHNADIDKLFEEAVTKYIKIPCFSADDVVETEDGSKVKMENLKVGNMVLARDGQGKLFYDTVYMFGHREEAAFCDFVIFETTKQNVSVTENHLVFCVRNELEICVAAGCVQPGDKLMVAVSDQNVEQIPIIKVSRQRKRGLFAPFTKSGTVVVNGALMSCYVDIVTHQTAHKALWPLRQLYDISPSTLAFVNGAKKNTAVPVLAETAYNVISYLKNTRNKLSKYFN